VSITEAANYRTAVLSDGGTPVIHLTDQATGTHVAIHPARGNNARSMTVRGEEVMWTSPDSTSGRPALDGNPLLWPWANRIAGESYWANGKQHRLNSALGNVRKDGSQYPIHGLLMFTDAWELGEVRATSEGATATAKIEFWKHPEWMAQFPFAHTIIMNHRLKDGVLEVETVLRNHSSQPMPVSLGYHPYFQLTDSPRDDWKVRLAARDHVVLNPQLTPTGETKPVPFSDPHALKGSQLDDVFTGLVRGSDGRAVFSVQGRRQKLEVIYGPNYPVAVVYAPPGRGFICFEPMTGVTNVFNLAHEGKFPLQSVPPGGEWRESFWIRPSGF